MSVMEVVDLDVAQTPTCCRICGGAGRVWVPCADLGSVQITCSCMRKDVAPYGRTTAKMAAVFLLIALLSAALVSLLSVQTS